MERKASSGILPIADPINELTDRLHSTMSLASSSLEQLRQFLNADLEYVENIKTGTQQILQTIELTPQKGFTDTIEQQQLGMVWVNIRAGFQALGTHVSTITIPELQKRIAALIKAQQEWDITNRAHIADLRKAFLSFEQEMGRIPKSTNIKNMREYGEKSHGQCALLIKQITNEETLVLNALTNIADLQAKTMKEEDELIYSLSSILCGKLPYSTVSTAARTIEEKDKIETIIRDVKLCFFDLKTFVTAPKNMNGIVPMVWKSEPRTDEFYARVWSDFDSNKPDELKVRKREIVTVIKTHQHGYWYVKKANGMRGYVRSDCLEPLE